MLNDNMALDLTMTALAHPVRRGILERVMRQEARVTDSGRAVRHLRSRLFPSISAFWSGRISCGGAECGASISLSYNPAPLDEAAQWIAKTRAFWGSRLDVLDAVLRAEDAALEPRPSGDHP